MTKELVAVIPAAGASREIWRGVGTGESDALLPIAGKPAIYWTIQNLIAVGVSRIAVVVRQRDNELERLIKLLFSHCVDLQFTAPPAMLGVGYSVLMGARLFGESARLLVVLGDTIARLKDAASLPTDSTVYVSEVDDFDRWCLAAETGGNVRRLYNKPSHPVDTNLALIGIYYFAEGRAAFEWEAMRLETSKSTIEMADLLQPLIEGGKLRVRRTEEWLDVGNPDHVFAAQSRLIQSRSFNRLSVDGVKGTITKQSTYEAKFYDEINYYRLLPENLAVYFPRVVSQCVAANQLSLSLEYYAYPSFADLFLFANLSAALWKRLFQQLGAITDEFLVHEYGSAADCATSIYVRKNVDRITAFMQSPPPAARRLVRADNLRVNGVPVPTFEQAIARSEPRLRALSASAKLTTVHGDLCFSNVLCEPAQGLIKLIDPRGSFGEKGVLGDFRYDIAKLSHSAIGLYDYLVNDLFRLKVVDDSTIEVDFPSRPEQREIQQAFRDTLLRRYPSEEISLITAWLFLSMLPLHSDSPVRQIAMAARGLQLLSSIDL